MQQLGNTLDFGVAINPVADLAAGNNTGKRVHMRNYDVLAFAFFKNPASAGTDTVTITLQEHNAASSGTSQNLAAIGDVYYKSTAAALAGTEAWTFLDNRSAGAKQATLAMADSGAIKAANQAIVVFEVEAGALSAGFQWLSVNIADPGSGGTILGGVFWIGGGLKIMRNADLLAQPNA